MFVSILLRDLARDFGVEFERLHHREIFEISARADKKTMESHLKSGGFPDQRFLKHRSKMTRDCFLRRGGDKKHMLH